MTEQQNTNNSPDNSTPIKSNKKTYCKIIGGVVLIAILFILLLLTSLSFSSGQQALVRLADKFIDKLKIEQVSGDLQTGLELKNLRFTTTGIESQVDLVRVQINLKRLFDFAVEIDEISLEKPQIHIDRSLLTSSENQVSETKNQAMAKINLPFSALIKKLQINNLDLQIDHQHIQLPEFNSAISLNNETGLTLAPTAINKLSIVSEKTFSNATPTSNETKEPMDWQALEQSLNQAFLANLSEINFPFDLHIKSLSAQDWTYQQQDQQKIVSQINLNKFLLQADLTGQQAELKTLQLESSVADLQGSGNISLNQDFPLSLQLKAQLKAWQAIAATNIDLQINGNLKQSTQLSLHSQGLVDGKLTAEVKLNESKTPLNLHWQIKQAEYPLVATQPPLQLNNMDLLITGDLLNYQAKLKGQLQGMNHIPKTQIQLFSEGKIDEINIHQLDLTTTNGNAKLTGKANWRKETKWELITQLDNMNLAAYMANMPTSLSGQIKSYGSMGLQNWQVEIPLLDLTGKLNQRPLTINTQLRLSDQHLLNIDHLLLDYGNNKLNAQGLIDHQHSDFKLNINAPNLTGFWPDLNGSIVGSLNLQGKMQTPAIELELNSHNLHFHELNLKNAQINATLNTENNIQGNINVALNQFVYADQVNIQRVNLTASGDEENHQLQLTSDGLPATLDLQLQGSFDRNLQNWNGILSQLHIHSTMGEFSPDQAININYNHKQTQAIINHHCWHNSDLNLCFPQSFQIGNTGNIPLELKTINLALLNKLLKQDMLSGLLSSQGNINWSPDKALQFNLALEGKNLNVAHRIDYRTFNLELTKVSLKGAMENNNLNLTSEILLPQGKINTNLNLTDIVSSRQLNGTLTLADLNLNLANQLLSTGEFVNGEIESQLSFAGTLNAPTINGNFAIKNIQAKLKSSPVPITAGNINIQFERTRSTLQGILQSEDSLINLNADANWQNINNWNSNLSAQSDKFKLNIPSIGELEISHNIKISATPKLLKLTGDVAIPYARIAIESLPDSAETISEDEIILNGPNQTKEKLLKREFATTTQSGMQIEADFKINIGDDVRLDAYGLKTNLNGLLAIRQDKGKLGLFGQINLDDGYYTSFGQDLIIRKGLISFSGTASQPMLNIEAIRNPDAMEDNNITAGVKVTGLPDSPNIEVFTTPSSSQDQALSYLITGRSLENSGETGSSSSVGAALLGVGLAKTGKLVGSIGEAFGIQDLNLGTSGIGDSSKVVVSGNITKNLQVKYGVGIFDGLAEVTLRYRLLPQLYFQSVSSTNQVFDLLYQFEF